MKIGAITIGQSPRTDVAPEFQAALGVPAELLQCGALDDLSAAQVAELAPGPGEPLLVTRMRDGSEVQVAEGAIHRRMGTCLRRLEAEGVDLMVLFCTGEFPGLESETLILRPDLLMERLVPGILDKGRLGVVLPSPKQGESQRKKWAKTGLDLELVAASPYTGGEEDFRAAARQLASRNVGLIVLDCIGFNEEMRRIFREESGKPVILPRSLLGRVAGELMGGRG